MPTDLFIFIFYFGSAVPRHLAHLREARSRRRIKANKLRVLEESAASLGTSRRSPRGSGRKETINKAAKAAAKGLNLSLPTGEVGVAGGVVADAGSSVLELQQFVQLQLRSQFVVEFLVAAMNH